MEFLLYIVIGGVMSKIIQVTVKLMVEAEDGLKARAEVRKLLNSGGGKIVAYSIGQFEEKDLWSPFEVVPD